MLGLAGMILMVSADTKDVEATGKISYKSENLQEGLCMTAGIRTAEVSGEALTRLQAERASRAEEEERGRMARQAQEAAAAKERAAAEDSGAAETAEEAAQEAAAETGRIYEVSEEDYDALLRLVEAEASGEDIKGKLLVANVVLNRVKSGAFPDTIKEVIYQRQNGRAQFSPVAHRENRPGGRVRGDGGGRGAGALRGGRIGGRAVFCGPGLRGRREPSVVPGQSDASVLL